MALVFTPSGSKEIITSYQMYIAGNVLNTNSVTIQNWNISDLNQVNDWLGRSEYSGDSDASASWDEVRIWDTALTQAQLVGLDVAGPDVSFVSGNTLPSTSAVSIASGATLDLDGNNQQIASLSNSGGSGGSVINSGSGASTLTLSPSAGSTTFGGTIGGGSINLVETGTGTLTLTGANTYTGGTAIDGGVLSVSSDANLGADPGMATPGNVTINGGTLLASASFTLNSNRGIALGDPSTPSTGGEIDVAAGSTLTYGGVIANNTGGSDSLTVGSGTNTGTLVLNGNSTFTGGVTLDAGILAGSGSLAGSVTVSSGTTLAGTETITGTTLVNGTLDPAGSSSTGIVTTGNLFFGSTGTLAVELNGTTAGTTYDQVDVSGSITLNNATLDVASVNTSMLTAGVPLIIIDNTGSNAINGTFNGMPEGTVIPVSGIDLRISYVGGPEDNSVTLTETGPPVITSLSPANGTPAGDTTVTMRYALRSEASLRFEKGQEVRLARIGADRVAQLIAEWAGGTIAAGRIDTAPTEPEPSRRVSAGSRRAPARRVDRSRGAARPAGTCRHPDRTGSSSRHADRRGRATGAHSHATGRRSRDLGDRPDVATGPCDRSRRHRRGRPYPRLRNDARHPHAHADAGVAAVAAPGAGPGSPSARRCRPVRGGDARARGARPRRAPRVATRSRIRHGRGDRCRRLDDPDQESALEPALGPAWRPRRQPARCRGDQPAPGSRGRRDLRSNT